MTLYIDIGYTNVKVLDDNEKVQIFPATEKNLTDFLFTNKEKKIFIINNNNFLVNSLKINWKQLKVYQIQKTDFLDLMTFDNEFKKEEIGIDLLAIIYYLKTNHFKEGLILSCGSGLVSLVFKEYQLYSVAINLGISYSQAAIKSYLDLEATTICIQRRGTDTKNALELGNFLLLKGLILANIETFQLENPLCLITGNQLKKEDLELLKSNNYELIFIEHLVLKGLKCLIDNHAKKVI